MTFLAATDFSAGARAAVERAALLARECGARLELVHAFDKTSWRNLLALAEPRAGLFAEQPLHLAGEKIRELAAQISRQHGITASGAVTTGPAPGAIAAVARARRASILVVGAHGRRLGDRIYLGSTALKTVRAVSCPVLVARATPKAGYKRCLVGVDFSAPSERAALAAARFFPSTGITLLHAVPSAEGPMLLTGALREAINAATARLRVEAVERMSRIFPAGESGRRDPVRRRAVVAPAARALLRELKDGDYDLVVLGRDSKGELAEKVLGSVPASVLLNASVDVLIVP